MFSFTFIGDKIDSSFWVHAFLVFLFEIICYFILNSSVIYFSFRSNLEQSLFDKSLFVDLINMIDEHNVLGKSFRRVRNFSHHDSKSDFTLRLF